MRTDAGRQVQARLADLAERACTELGLEHVATRWQRGRIEVMADHPGGMTIEACEALSRRLEATLDADDFVPGPYVLEVMSPGPRRPLCSMADVHRFVGRRVRVKPLKGRGQAGTGILRAAAEDEFTLRREDGVDMVYRWADVAAAHLQEDRQGGKGTGP